MGLKDTSTVLFLLMHDFIERRRFSQRVQKTRMDCSIGVLDVNRVDPPRVSRLAEKSYSDGKWYELASFPTMSGQKSIGSNTYKAKAVDYPTQWQISKDLDAQQLRLKINES